VAGSLQDVTELRRLEQRLDYLLNYDPVTGLPNRALLNDRLRQVVLTSARRHLLAAVMVLDIDHFKNINETVGPQLGDELLKAVADRLVSQLRQVDTFARLSGDEFALVAAELGQVEDAARLAQRIHDILAAPFSVGGHEVFVSTSAGISVHPIDGREADVLLTNAEVAMHRAKEAGGATYRYFTSDMNARAGERLSLETDLRRALERDQFVLEYQPLLDVRTSTVAGVESLIRWRHPERGLVPPAGFIPILEETGLITQVGAWVLRTACQQLSRWRAQGVDPGRMLVNLSGRQFSDGDLVDIVGLALSEADIDPDGLELEITENVIMSDTESTFRTINALDRLGIRLAVDDFGTGYSSLAYLKKLPVSVLKIDRSFVGDMSESIDSAVIVRSTIELAHNLGLNVVAEGVETEEIFDMLTEMGCDVAQGFLFSRPLPADTCAAWIADRA
jgi:diguanylate cyclase (GGDEF)-like protein